MTPRILAAIGATLIIIIYGLFVWWLLRFY
jgi:hypothetical protein